jgi:hypothetical protein
VCILTLICYKNYIIYFDFKLLENYKILISFMINKNYRHDDLLHMLIDRPGFKKLSRFFTHISNIVTFDT